MATAPIPKRSQLFKSLDKSLHRARFNGWWSLLMIPYLPFGLILTVLRLFMSLQVLLMLLLVPEGKLKRFMLRISLGVLGIAVTTEGENSKPKVFIANRLSYIDNIVLHLATNCQTVSIEGTPSYSVPSLFNHRSLKDQDDESISDQLASDIHGCVDYVPLAVQPEPLPTNGSTVLIFRQWPFSLDCTVQPVAISAFRPWPVEITRATSSGWWDLLWTLFVPFTHFHVRFLESCERGEKENTIKFAIRVQNNIADALKIKTLTANKEDIDKWLKDPPLPAVPAPQRPPSMPKGPVIPISEFNQINKSPVGEASAGPLPPEVEAMVQQVTAVMPQVPYTAIRKDLMSTHSVDQTITNILEGRVKYTPIPTLHEATSVRSGAGDSVMSKSQVSQSLFGGNKSRSAHLSQQRQMSLDDRKKLLFEQARRRYTEKHGH